MVIKPIPKTTKTTRPPLVEVGEVKVLPKSMPGSFKFKLPAETMPPPPHQHRWPYGVRYAQLVEDRLVGHTGPSLAASLAVPRPVLIPRQPLFPPPDALLRTEAEAAEARLFKLRTIIGGAEAEAAEATAIGVPACGAGSAGDEEGVADDDEEGVADDDEEVVANAALGGAGDAGDEAIARWVGALIDADEWWQRI